MPLILYSPKKKAVITSTTSLLSNTAHAPAIVVGANQLTAYFTMGGWSGGRSDTVISSGKRYWEVSVTDFTGSGMIGIIDAASIDIGMTNTGVLGGSYVKSVGLHVVNGLRNYNNNPAWTTVRQTLDNNCKFTSNTDVLGFGLDMTTGELRIFKNGVDQGVFISGITTPVFPAYCIGASGLILTFNFGAAGFKYLPAGYTPI